MWKDLPSGKFFCCKKGLNPLTYTYVSILVAFLLPLFCSYYLVSMTQQLQIIISLLLWWCLWYLIFYFRFENREIINELRKNLKKANKELQHASHELEEFSQQNKILKQNMSDMMNKNEDLTHVVWELSRYYYNIKVGAQKVEDLAQHLTLPDDTIEQTMKWVLNQHRHGNSASENDERAFF